MPITAFLKIPDIDGESKAAEHEDEIDIFDVSWEIERDTSPLRRGRLRGRVDAGPVSVRKYYDASSPYIALAAAQGRAFDEVVLTVRKDSGDTHLDYLTITMERVVITSYAMEGQDEGPRIAEQIELAFESITLTYVEQAEDGSAGDEHEAEIDPNSAV